MRNIANNTIDGKFNEREYLVFLRDGVCSELRSQIEMIGGVELDLNKDIDIESIMEPLQICNFPRSNFSAYESVLTSILISYLDKKPINEDQAFEMLYLSSLYIFCYCKDSLNTQDGIMPLACAIYINAIKMLSMTKKELFIKYLKWVLIEEGNELKNREDYPELSIYLSLYLILKESTKDLDLDIFKLLQSNTVLNDDIKGTSIGDGFNMLLRLLDKKKPNDKKIIALIKEKFRI